MNPNSSDELISAIHKLNQRMDAIEKRLSTPSPLTPSSTPNPIKNPLVTPATDQKREQRPSAYSPTSRKTVAESSGLSAGSFLGAVGVICFIFAASLIIKLTITSGWLTPLRQWGSLMVLGASLLWGGIWMRSRDEKYSGYLAGAGVVVLFIGGYTSNLFFEIAGLEVAFGLAIGTSILCLVLHGIFQGSFFAASSVLGTYSTPVILGSHHSASLPILSGYYVLWSALFAWISTGFGSRTMQLTAACAGIGIYGLLNLGRSTNEDYLLIIAIQFIQFMALLYGVIRYSIVRDEPLTSREAWSFSPVLIFFYATEYYYLNLWNPTLAPWISLGFSGILIFLYRVAQNKLSGSAELASGPLVGAFAALSIVHAGYFELLPKTFKPFCLPLIAIAYLITAGIRNPFLVFACIAIALFEYLRICAILIMDRHEPLVLLAGILSSLALLLVISVRQKKETQDQSTILLLFTHILSVLSIYRLAYDQGSLAVSIGWGLYSIGVLGFAFSRNDATLARSSLIVFLIAAAKALLYDASQAATLIRVICLMVTGLLLYGSGYLFRKISENKTN